jgi:hypothetical protein
VIKNDLLDPGQLLMLALIETVIIAVIGKLPVLLATKTGMLPTPLAAKPIRGLLFVHEKEESGDVLLKGIPFREVPLQTVVSSNGLIIGVGLTVTDTVSFATHPFPDPVDNLKTYVTTMGCAVVSSNISLMTGPVPVPAEFLTPNTAALVQLKLVPVAELIAV